MREIESIEDLQQLLGQELGVSDWLLIDQERINKFADATGDYQWIHLDAARARQELPGGTTIAHGYLIVALLPMLTARIYQVKNSSRRLNYGSNRVRFTNSVTTGSRIRARQRLKTLEPFKGSGVQATFEITVEIDGQQRPACVAETITVFLP